MTLVLALPTGLLTKFDIGTRRTTPSHGSHDTSSPRAFGTRPRRKSGRRLPGKKSWQPLAQRRRNSSPKCRKCSPTSITTSLHIYSEYSQVHGFSLSHFIYIKKCKFWNLFCREQKAEMEEHLKTYGAEYPLNKYQGE